MNPIDLWEKHWLSPKHKTFQCHHCGKPTEHVRPGFGRVRLGAHIAFSLATFLLWTPFFLVAWVRDRFRWACPDCGYARGFIHQYEREAEFPEPWRDRWFLGTTGLAALMGAWVYSIIWVGPSLQDPAAVAQPPVSVLRPAAAHQPAPAPIQVAAAPQPAVDLQPPMVAVQSVQKAVQAAPTPPSSEPTSDLIPASPEVKAMLEGQNLLTNAQRVARATKALAKWRPTRPTKFKDTGWNYFEAIPILIDPIAKDAPEYRAARALLEDMEKDEQYRDGLYRKEERVSFAEYLKSRMSAEIRLSGAQKENIELKQFWTRATLSKLDSETDLLSALKSFGFRKVVFAGPGQQFLYTFPEKKTKGPLSPYLKYP